MFYFKHTWATLRSTVSATARHLPSVSNFRNQSETGTIFWSFVNISTCKTNITDELYKETKHFRQCKILAIWFSNWCGSIQQCEGTYNNCDSYLNASYHHMILTLFYPLSTSFQCHNFPAKVFCWKTSAITLWPYSECHNIPCHVLTISSTSLYKWTDGRSVKRTHTNISIFRCSGKVICTWYEW